MPRASFYYLLLFSFFFHLCMADPIGEYCNREKNITNDEISANIDLVLGQLEAKAPLNGFATTAAGSSPNQVYGLVQCRQDVSSENCSTCISNAAKKIRQRCPNQADARIWFDYCFLRYDTEEFIGKLDTGFGIILYNVQNVSDGEAFDKEVGTLMDRVRAQAVMPSNRGLGKDMTKFSPSITIYGLVQCTRDLSGLSCAQCLAMAIANFPKFCKHRQGCQVLYSSCRVRYEIYPFFFPIHSQNKVATSSLRVFMYP